jgi:hypothetical protein
MLVDKDNFTEMVAKAVHSGWYDWMEERGWSYGIVQDDEEMEHPHMMDYDDMTVTDLESTMVAAERVVEVMVETGMIRLGEKVKEARVDASS